MDFIYAWWMIECVKSQLVIFGYQTFKNKVQIISIERIYNNSQIHISIIKYLNKFI